MKLKFENASVKHSVSVIMEFTKTGASPFWSDPFFYFYPDIDRQAFMSLDDNDRLIYLKKYFSDFLKSNEQLLNEKNRAYNEYWSRHELQITQALEDAFNIDLSGLFNDLICMTSFSHISPRYLAKNCFDHFYMESEKGATGTAIHEIIHFVWFFVWHNLFSDSYEEYEKPSLKWILSEMVVEPVMRDDRLSSLNPYYNSRSCVYSFFYTMKIDGKPILDILYEMYQSMPIHDFMKASYQFCIDNEPEIRAKMNI